MLHLLWDAAVAHGEGEVRCSVGGLCAGDHGGRDVVAGYGGGAEAGEEGGGFACAAGEIWERFRVVIDE